MDRAKVICHMMTTIDGKISIDFDGNPDYMAVGDQYDRRVFSYGQAYIFLPPSVNGYSTQGGFLFLCERNEVAAGVTIWPEA